MATTPIVSVLIVEDSPTQLAQLQRTLQGRGYEVFAAKNGMEAIETLRTQQPTLVISDVVMPEMDGYELCARIKADEKLKELPVILLTSLANPKELIKGLKCGADSFIVKPYENASLVARIESLLANQKLRKQTGTQKGIEILFSGQNELTCSKFVTSELIHHAKILIVDDELSNVRLLEKILTRAGYKNLSMTTDSQSFVSMFVDDNPDLMLLDLHMPHLDGHKALELLRSLVPQEAFVPVIVLSADITPNARHRALAGGAIDFVNKPFDNTEVLLRIRNALFTRFLHCQLQNQNALLEERVKDRTRLLEESISELRRCHDGAAQKATALC
jgi:DNA-binding response OmpR family regulator